MAMRPRRAMLILMTVVAVVAAGGPSAFAHHGSEDTPRGILIVPAGGERSMAVGSTNPGDTVQWTWNLGPTSPAAAEQVSVHFVWTDAAGREHAADPAQVGHLFGTFVAPNDYKIGRLTWRNSGVVAAEVQWNYGVSAPFWSRPRLFLPAFIPVMILIASMAFGKIVDARGRHRVGQQDQVSRGATYES